MTDLFMLAPISRWYLTSIPKKNVWIYVWDILTASFSCLILTTISVFYDHTMVVPRRWPQEVVIRLVSDVTDRYQQIRLMEHTQQLVRPHLFYIVQKRGPLQNEGLLFRIQNCQDENPFLFSLNGNILLNAIKIGNFSFQFFEFCKFNLFAPPFYIFCNSGRMKTKFLILSRIFSYNDVTSRHGRSSKFFTLKRKS